jgi:aspartate/tyrosine/aromatic aminotransferase
MWTDVPEAPADPIFGLTLRCKLDSFLDKIDLGVGAYRDEEGKPYPLRVVLKAEKALADACLDKEYLPIDGMAAFREASIGLLLGKDSQAIKEKRVATCQGLSGTGCLRLAIEFYKMFIDSSTACYNSKPTWGNHQTMFKSCGFSNLKEYRYFDAKTKGVDFEGMCSDLRDAPSKSIVILQVCAHNPTGADPTVEQWEIIAQIVKEKQHYALLDAAYQGYATGDLDNDARAARIFERAGLEFAISQSYAKNMGLYGERIGCTSFVCTDAATASRVSSQLKVVVRPMYSNPPVHGARIVTKILTDPNLYSEWVAELSKMSGRIKCMREMLYTELQRLGTPGDWSHIVKQIGMFSFTGLTAPQCERLITQHHIYLLSNGRISIAGLSAKTVPRLAAAMHDVITN